MNIEPSSQAGDSSPMVESLQRVTLSPSKKSRGIASSPNITHSSFVNESPSSPFTPSENNITKNSHNMQNFSFPDFLHRQSISWTLIAMSIGYLLGRSELQFSWFLVLLIIIYSISSRVFRDSSRTINELLRQKKLKEWKQWREMHLPKYLTNNGKETSTADESSKITTDQNRKDATLSCVNTIIDQFWRGFNSEFIVKMANDWLKENPIASNFDIQVSFLDIDNDNPPFFTSIYCSENTPKKTVIDACIEYNGELFLQWFVKLLIPIQFLLKDVSAKVKTRIVIEYSDNLEEFGRTISKVDMCLMEYPQFNVSVQMFNSLDLTGSIPSLQNQLKLGFEKALLKFVYPKFITAYKYGDEGRNSGLNLEIDKIVVEGLEEEIKSNLFNINQLLKAINKSNGENKEQIKVEVCTNILTLLHQAREPGKIPIGMTDTIRNGFQILNMLTFGEIHNNDSAVNEKIMEILLQTDNLLFIADVVRKCTLADELVMNILFKVKDPKLKQQVNKRFQELELGDILFTVVGRNERPKQ
ncbi:hypothetical protein FDP41_013513 [Naegleria fowleri]|uniref:Uncharacterized protein n=1 Tax=Naegleria fowleri TaxID=5763 RepID=A0A6A5C4N6_NAEFO|nr:uncharacterized protein FDP41_013513 [Naegleria fowleri]KAF0980299.1 hypothetical protein FDP41_013513 [Naegleria fowleri]